MIIFEDNEHKVSCKDYDDLKRAVLIEKLLDWYVEHDSYCGESILQNDDFHMDAVEILANLADNHFKFEDEWK